MSVELELPSTEAILNYLAPTAERPRSYTYAPPPGIPQRSGRPEPHSVRVRDARKLVLPARLDVEGFALVPQVTKVRDFYDADQIAYGYFPEIEFLLRAVTGAEAVAIFDYTLRSGSAEQREILGVREPVRSVHNDYTSGSGKRRVTDHLPAVEAERRLRGRHAIVNVWRPISSVVESTPLAVCDARSIRTEDWVPTDLIYPDRIGEVYSVRYNPAHRWYFYPRQRRNEALLIKTYDSLEDGTARFSAHTAFDDPDTPANAAPRQSIEVRALVFFPQLDS